MSVGGLSRPTARAIFKLIVAVRSATAVVAVSQRLRLHRTAKPTLRKIAPRSERHRKGGEHGGITRRHLALTALVLGAAGMLPSRGSLAQSSDEASVSAAVEALTKAMLGADRAQLEDLTSDQLSYGPAAGSRPRRSS
jgi:hypothetical protein